VYTIIRLAILAAAVVGDQEPGTLLVLVALFVGTYLAEIVDELRKQREGRR